MTVTGNIFLRGVTAIGIVDLNGTKIGGQFVCVEANLDGKSQTALDAQNAYVIGDISLEAIAPNSDVVITSQGWLAVAAQDCLPIQTKGCDENPAATWSDKGAAGTDWDSFSALGYAADLVIPILDLGQTDAWAPSKDRGAMGGCSGGGAGCWKPQAGSSPPLVPPPSPGSFSASRNSPLPPCGNAA